MWVDLIEKSDNEHWAPKSKVSKKRGKFKLRKLYYYDEDIETRPGIRKSHDFENFNKMTGYEV